MRAIHRDDTLVVRQSFNDFRHDEGYLVLEVGSRLVVDFVGTDGDESGWFFGHEVDAPSTVGWFPRSAVALPEDELVGELEVDAPDAEARYPESPVALLEGDLEEEPEVDAPDAEAPESPVASSEGELKREPEAPKQSSPRDALKLGAGAKVLLDGVDAGAENWLEAATTSASPQVIHTMAAPPPPPAIQLPAWSPTPPPLPAAEALAPVEAPQPVTELAGWTSLPAPQSAAISMCAPDEGSFGDAAEEHQPEFGFDSSPPVGLLESTRRGLDAAASLPMASLCDELIGNVTRHRVVVVDAATGSGKSTLVPLCLANRCAELGRNCRIVVTQPRRIAAKGLARRVSQQCNTQVGDLVAGYRVGNDRCDRGASIVYVTAGHLLEALVHNPRHLELFSHIVLDEVHERFVQADFLAALLRFSLSRPETLAVRIVVMSATLQKALGDFFRPLLLPAPARSEPGRLSLQGRTPFKVRDMLWEDMKAEWPEVFSGGFKEPNFNEVKPSRARLLPTRRRSDQLTRLCKELAPFCARLLCQLRNLSRHDEETPCISLVFLPGLDQMREVEDAVKHEAQRFRYKQPEIYMMHSALEEDNYAQALETPSGGVWRVVLATNIAESSLTVPGVNAVIDFGTHRVSVYDDEARMSTLVTEWCSRASMLQRRGRTGRTVDGWYLRLLSQAVLDELSDFDESGVEKAPLGRVVLEAAHLAQLLSARPVVRAGLPVAFSTEDGVEEGVAAFWDGPGNGWHVVPDLGAGHLATTLDDAKLQPLRIDARRILGLLPTPPKEDRVVSALAELRELGALGIDDSPSVLGTAYLKLPVDVVLGRLVVLGCLLGCPTDAIILAAALSLSPSCDVLRTPFNMKSELTEKDLVLLEATVKLRREADGGNLSEPMTVHSLCMEWLRSGGGDLGRAPRNMRWRGVVHERLWVQFTTLVIELSDSLLRLVPEDSDEAQKLRLLVSCAHGRGRSATAGLQDPWPARHLMALLTVALAPLGFIAIGQTPALYGSAGGYSTFMKAVRDNNSTVASALWWPNAAPEVARKAVRACKGSVQWSERGASQNEAYLGVASQVTGDVHRRHCLGDVSELLCRLCGPFNGKETSVTGHGISLRTRPPRNPCMMNWYMPRPDGRGLLEVRVGWKSQAETLLHVPRPTEKGARCRPKEFLLASGGEYLNAGGRRTIALRGINVLPSEDGGRSALLWLLAAGQPHDGRLVTLMAPRTLRPDDFEVRALRLWHRTLWLPSGRGLTSSDLQAVNRFRCALLALQEPKPHRLAGSWRVEGTGDIRHIRCIDVSSLDKEEREAEFGSGASLERGPVAAQAEVLMVSGGTSNFVLHARHGGLKWRTAAGTCWCEEEFDSTEISWTDGSRWTRTGSTSTGAESESPVLGALGLDAVEGLRAATTDLLEVTPADPEFDDDDLAASGAAEEWPGRLVPLVSEAAEALNQASPEALNGDQRNGKRRHGRNLLATPLSPFDLGAAEKILAAFTAQLRPSDLEKTIEQDAGAYNDDDSDSDDDLPESVANEDISENYMWKLAEHTPNWGPDDSRKLIFVESAIALPQNAVCSECDQEGKTFSKSQLTRHPDDRRCRDCVARSLIVAKSYAASAAKTANAAPRLGSATSPVAGAITPGPTKTSSVPVCSACGTQLTKLNCSPSQRKKEANRRRCDSCVGSPGDGVAAAT